ncbi:MAG: hypothetical protein M0005_10290 [Actinomycetota bacterium]|nr:hypothetical protein [Actinomycetota bacterium]
MPSSPSGSLPLNGVAAVPGSGSITLSVLDSTIAAQNAVAVGSPSGAANSVSVTTSASSRASCTCATRKSAALSTRRSPGECSGPSRG